MYLFFPIAFKTLINNMEWLEPGTVGKWELGKNKIMKNKYWYWRYDNNKLELKEAVDRLDKKLDTAMKQIKEKCGDVVYGIGLSGGLDSRLIPYYALKNNMKLKAFIIADKHPRSFLLSRDCQSSRKIAEFYGIELTEISTYSISAREQMEIDMVKNMNDLHNIGKIAGKNLPYFDVLLSGGSGYLVGSKGENKTIYMSDEELATYISRATRLLNAKTLFEDRVERLLKYILNININFSETNKYISKEVTKKNYDYWKKYVQERRQEGYSNIDIYMMYFNDTFGFRNRNGAFESICGEKRAFSIYIPFLLEESLKWSIDLLQDRKIVNELINSKIPELSTIKKQSYEAGINKKDIVSKVIALLDFVFRSSGTGRIGSRKKKKEIDAYIESIMNNDCVWFKEILSIEYDNILKQLRKYDYENRVKYTMAKRKLIIDIIERGDYKKYGL